MVYQKCRALCQQSVLYTVLCVVSKEKDKERLACIVWYSTLSVFSTCSSFDTTHNTVYNTLFWQSTHGSFDTTHRVCLAEYMAKRVGCTQSRVLYQKSHVLHQKCRVLYQKSPIFYRVLYQTSLIQDTVECRALLVEYTALLMQHKPYILSCVVSNSQGAMCSITEPLFARIQGFLDQILPK